MKKYNSFLLILATTLISTASCRSAKSVNSSAPASDLASETANSCNKSIRLYSDNIKNLKDGTDMESHTVITINPSTNLISIKLKSATWGDAGFDSIIDNVDCNFNSDLTAGEAIYNVHINQQDGSQTRESIKVEFKDGSAYFTGNDAGQAPEIMIEINKWEFFDE